MSVHTLFMYVPFFFSTLALSAFCANAPNCSTLKAGQKRESFAYFELKFFFGAKQHLRTVVWYVSIQEKYYHRILYNKSLRVKVYLSLLYDKWFQWQNTKYVRKDKIFTLLILMWKQKRGALSDPRQVYFVDWFPR